MRSISSSCVGVCHGRQSIAWSHCIEPTLTVSWSKPGSCAPDSPQHCRAMYGAEVPAYNTLVDVSTEVNRDTCAADDRLGSLERVTAERHGAIRVGSARELADVADLFAAFGMYPVGFYDLREAASPVPVVSTAFRPIDADELARNPFRVFTSMLATADARFFDADLRARVERFVGSASAVRPRADRRGQAHRRRRRCRQPRADEFVAAAVSAFALSREPIDRGWYEELAAVSAVAADIAGVTYHAHQPPDPAGARHRRVVPADDRPRHHDDRRHPGPTALARPRCAVAADVVSGTGRTAPLPRRRRHGHRRHPAGALRRGRGARGGADTRRAGNATTPRWPLPDPAAAWGQYFPATDAEMAADGLAYYRGGDPTKPVVYEDFLPASAAGHLPVQPRCRHRRPPKRPTIRTTASTGWPARSATTSTIPTTSTRKSHHHDHAFRPSRCPPPTTCAPGSATR